MKFTAFFIFFMFIGCVVNPRNYTYRNNFDLESYNKQNGLSFLITDCVYINSDEMDTYRGLIKTYQFMQFFKNGRVYISKTFIDSIPQAEFYNFKSFEDLYITQKKIDYDSGRKAYYQIDKKGLLKIEQYISSGSGFTIVEGTIRESEINIHQAKKIYKAVKIKNIIANSDW